MYEVSALVMYNSRSYMYQWTIWKWFFAIQFYMRTCRWINCQCQGIMDHKIHNSGLTSLTAHHRIATYHTKFPLMEVNDDEIYIGDKGDIPVEILSLLPDSQVSVIGLLQHPLPPMAHGFALSSSSSYFDNNPPNVTDNDIIFTIPIPPAISVIALDKAFPEAVQNGYQSLNLKCLHIESTVGKT